jgi:fatty acid desaturase
MTAQVAAVDDSYEPVRSARDLLPGAALLELTRRSDRRGAVRLAAHAGCIAATALLVWLATPYWLLLIPAMALHGVTLVTLFAPMHECVHRTAFASRRANDAVAWLAGLLSFYNSTFYWYFHVWHHRYTQDPERDPELAFPKARNRLEYLKEIGGANFWRVRLIDYLGLALGLVRRPFIPEHARRRIAVSMSVQLLIYLAAAVSVALGSTIALYYWFLPVILAQPFLRSLLVAEHTGCNMDANGLANTRTTLAGYPIRLLMWNMPFHAEHHLYPAVPFHRLPELHGEIRERLVHLAPDYLAANRAVLRSL